MIIFVTMFSLGSFMHKVHRVIIVNDYPAMTEYIVDDMLKYSGLQEHM